MQRKFILLIMSVGILGAYYIFVRYTGAGIPCLFYTILNLKCPGCGITHMLMALAAGRWREAFESNPYLFVSAPYLTYLCSRQIYCWLVSRELKMGRIQRGILYIYLAGLIVFGAVRNLTFI